MYDVLIVTPFMASTDGVIDNSSSEAKCLGRVLAIELQCKPQKEVLNYEQSTGLDLQKNPNVCGYFMGHIFHRV